MVVITFIFFCLIDWLNFILKEWLTISRGAEPHAQKADDEKVLKRVAHTCGVIWAERSDGPDYTTSVYYLYIHIYTYIYMTHKDTSSYVYIFIELWIYPPAPLWRHQAVRQ